jgi:CRISPR/Cas system endoribonuclease Cas6 (RAMP superfamily)
MMDEFIYNLLLTGEQGLSLFGTLRFRLTDPLTVVPDGGVPALLNQIEPIGTVTVVLLPAEGTISIPLLTGFSRVPISGALFATAAGPVTTLFGSTDSARPLFLQFNQISGNQIAGGVVWRSGEPAELVFSLLGTQLRLPF